MKPGKLILGLALSLIVAAFAGLQFSKQQPGSSRAVALVNDEKNQSFSILLPDGWKQDHDLSHLFTSATGAEISFEVVWKFFSTTDNPSIEAFRKLLIEDELKKAFRTDAKRNRFSHAGFDGVIVHNSPNSAMGKVVRSFYIVAVRGETTLIVMASGANDRTEKEIRQAIATLEPVK